MWRVVLLQVLPLWCKSFLIVNTQCISHIQNFSGYLRNKFWTNVIIKPNLFGFSRISHSIRIFFSIFQDNIWPKFKPKNSRDYLKRLINGNVWPLNLMKITQTRVCDRIFVNSLEANFSSEVFSWMSPLDPYSEFLI